MRVELRRAKCEGKTAGSASLARRGRPTADSETPEWDEPLLCEATLDRLPLPDGAEATEGDPSVRTRLLRNAKSYADRRDHRCPHAPAMQQSDADDGRSAPALAKIPCTCKHKSGSVGAVDQTAGAGALQQSRAVGSSRSRGVLWNATSHADPHSRGCPSAPAMQHSGGADVTVRPPPLATNS